MAFPDIKMEFTNRKRIVKLSGWPGMLFIGFDRVGGLCKSGSGIFCRYLVFKHHFFSGLTSGEFSKAACRWNLYSPDNGFTKLNFWTDNSSFSWYPNSSLLVAGAYNTL